MARPLVLVVDDDARTARTLARMLSEDGYEVDVAVDGAAAIARLGHGPPPDVLVTDVHMPGGDEAAIVYRARSLRPDMLVVVVTGYPYSVDRTLQPRPVVLTKPLVYGDLRAAIASAGLA